MKAVQFNEFGGADVLKMVEIEPPKPAKEQVLVKIKAAGVNFIDIYQRTGLYNVSLPYIAGLEGAGVVEETGEEVTEFSRGDSVAFTGSPGAYADYAVVDSAKLVKLPGSVDYKSAAAVMLQGMTAHYLVYSTFPLKKGDTCLVHAAAGGVGLLLIQLAKKCGATVIGTVSTRYKAELACDAGADHIIFYTEEDFEQRVMQFTNGKGVNVVYDSVGKSTFEKSLNCLQLRGYMVLYGQSSGPAPAINPQILNQKGSLFLTRPSLFHYIAGRDELLKRSGDILNLVEKGELKVRIHKIYPLDEVSQAHLDLESRKTTGKLIIIP